MKNHKIIPVLLLSILLAVMLQGTCLAAGTDDPDKWLMSDAYYDDSMECFVLTEDYKTWQTGAIWYEDQCFDDFVLDMDYYTGTSNRNLGGADGIVVVFYADRDYSMSGGEQLAFNGSGGYGVELDTHYNSSRGDPSDNHIALIKEGVENHLITEPLPESEDEQWHHLTVIVEDGECSAFVDNSLKFFYEVEPTENGWLGITAATGDGVNLHAVKNVQIYDDPRAFDRSALSVALHKNPSYSLDVLLGVGESVEYNPKLAHLLIDLCEEAGDEDKLNDCFRSMGFDNESADGDFLTDYSYDVRQAVTALENNPLVAYGLATRKLDDGSTVVLVVVRGTGALPYDYMGWIGNVLDSAANRFGEHSSFSDAGRGLLRNTAIFLGAEDGDIRSVDTSNTKFVITGHSRGAAAANIMAARMINLGIPESNVYCYTFACPDTTVIANDEAVSYRSIFNIGHVNDPVTWVPSAIWTDSGEKDGWGANSYWDKYGNSYWFSEDWDNAQEIREKISYSSYGPFNIINLVDLVDRAIDYHPQSRYLDYLKYEYDLSVFRDREETTDTIEQAIDADNNPVSYSGTKTMILDVFCPVDVLLLDGAGDAMVSIEGNQVDRAESFDGIVAIDGGKKRIVIPDAGDFDIRLVATDSGNMDFAVYTGEGFADALENGSAFTDVVLFEGKTMYASVTGDKGPENIELYAVDADGALLSQILSDGTEIPLQSAEEEEKGTDKNVETTVEVREVTDNNAENPETETIETESVENVPEPKIPLVLLYGIIAVETVLLLIFLIVLFVQKRRIQTLQNRNIEGEKQAEH